MASSLALGVGGDSRGNLCPKVLHGYFQFWGCLIWRPIALNIEFGVVVVRVVGRGSCTPEMA
jgi:hypothetical protein